MRHLAISIILVSSLFSFEQNLNIENSTFIIDATNTLDYNRLRLNYQASQGDFSARIIVDHDTLISDLAASDATINTFLNYTSDIPFETTRLIGTDPYNRMKLYRAYIKYEGEKHTLNLGLQRIAFGVGRLWTPVDMFNPLNSLSLESSERAPVLAAYYNYAINETSSFTAVVSQQKNKDYKGALRVKGNLPFGDAALLVIQETNRRLIGYELEGELFKTGVEMRSEGGVYTDLAANKNYTKFIVGADYAFENSLMLIGEYLYNENNVTTYYHPVYQKTLSIPDRFSDVIAHRDQHYFAAMLSYELSTLWHLAGFMMFNLEDQSLIGAPTVSYSISDESTFVLGGFFSKGDVGKEFETGNNILFLNYSLTF